MNMALYVHGCGSLSCKHPGSSSPSIFCRVHHITVAQYEKRCRIVRLAGLLNALGAAVGDQLCLEPEGRLAAKATLIKATAAAGDSVDAGSEEEGAELLLPPAARSNAPAANCGSHRAAGTADIAALPAPASLEGDEGGLWLPVSDLLALLEGQGESSLAMVAMECALNTPHCLAHHSPLRCPHYLQAFRPPPCPPTVPRLLPCRPMPGAWPTTPPCTASCSRACGRWRRAG